MESDLIEPKWLVKKVCVLNDVDKLMVRKDISQGDKLSVRFYSNLFFIKLRIIKNPPAAMRASRRDL